MYKYKDEVLGLIKMFSNLEKFFLKFTDGF